MPKTKNIMKKTAEDQENNRKVATKEIIIKNNS